MDWHEVEIDPKYGDGWTGYTWNKEFFPDHKRFLKNLHDRGMKTTLNVHPADGIRGHEECYPRVAEAMGVDVEKEEPVNFDIADPKFLSVYFDELHHPMEEEGVDFWWLDWQQGTNTKVEGLDPLWMLNHFHYLDSGRDGKRPMTFSRYAGPGSHRYPVGFSGDTFITWDSLEFQPYFTNTASNIGYGWWSHDIGGHMLGYRDEELEVRWYQYGVFSPINRLHSSNSRFSGKEPWKFSMEANHVMSEFLRLRHRLVPYLYTMNYRAWKEDKPLCQPMYYVEPEDFAAYKVPNQYMFGSELMVAPVTSKRIPSVRSSKVTTWLPEGVWFDIFNGRVYEGGRTMELYRPLSQIPVLARAGAILPMTDQISAKDVESNPQQLEIRVFAGADGAFTLYEDDNVSCGYEKGDCAETPMELNWTEKTFILHPVEGNTALVPEKRSYRIRICGSTASEAVVLRGGVEQKVPVSHCEKKQELCIELADVKADETIEIRLPKDTQIKSNPVVEEVDALLTMAEIAFMQKEDLFALVEKFQGKLNLLVGELQAMELDDALRGALMEIITARQ
jgi:alpha-glucosidase (family GH31 glycosyl hydrolase)